MSTPPGDHGAPSGPGAPGPGRGRPVHRVGDRALLVECPDGPDARALHAALLADPLPGQGELLPGARTVLVRLADPRGDPDGVRRLARALAGLPGTPAAGSPAAGSAGGSAEVVLDTVYDGADLDLVARALGTSVDALVAAHTGAVWTAAFVGFAPGFAYLEPDGATWDVPRRGTPRTSVPAGSVAVAGPYSAVYPRTSPGGWQLLGRTDAVLWDLARTPPALVTAGARVRFRAVRAVVRGAGTRATTAAAATSSAAGAGGPVGGRPLPRSGLEVVATGVLSLVEDLGRAGNLHLGVAPSGALDRRAAVRANRLVGNTRGAAVVETVLGGLTLRAVGPLVLAVTGAPVRLARTGPAGDARPAPSPRSPFRLADGEVLRLDAPPTGLRAYVAVRGGVAVGAVLGSRSTDVLAGLGPAPLAAGDVLPVGVPPADAVAGWPDPPDPAPDGAVEVRVVPGPRDDWVVGGVAALCDAPWLAGADLNRVGVRLTGAPLTRARTEELPSEGVVAGAVQVPPSGLPVVFLADHPVTGGYPVVAVVLDADLDRLAQVRPGDAVRFVPTLLDGGDAAHRSARAPGGGRGTPGDRV